MAVGIRADPNLLPGRGNGQGNTTLPVPTVQQGPVGSMEAEPPPPPHTGDACHLLSHIAQPQLRAEQLRIDDLHDGVMTECSAGQLQADLDVVLFKLRG